jgi:hypothetical protein
MKILKTYFCPQLSGLKIAIPLLSLLFTFSLSKSYSQSEIQKPQYKSWVKLQGEKGKMKSYIHKVDENGVHFLNRDYKSVGENYAFYGFDQIESIGIKKKGKIVKRLIVGALVGASFGVATGYISGDDPPNNCNRNSSLGAQLFCGLFSSPRRTAGEKAKNGAISGGIWGAAIGGLVRFRGHISLNKKSPKYNQDLEKLKTLELYR